METKASKPRSAEMFPGPGFRVKTEFERLESVFMNHFAEFDTPDISDLLNRLYAVDPAISCLTGRHHQLCGPACTVKVFPGDNLMVHKALDVARPNDIVVIDAHGSSMNAVLGDLISTKAKHRGIAGFIVDGFVRDLPDILELDFPVFACGLKFGQPGGEGGMCNLIRKMAGTFCSLTRLGLHIPDRKDRMTVPSPSLCSPHHGKLDRSRRGRD